MNPERILPSMLLAALAAATPATAAFPLLPVETAHALRGAPLAELPDPTEATGGSIEELPDDAGWLLVETSEGSIANRGTSFRFRFNADSELVDAVNEALAAPEGTDTDFVADAEMRRAAFSDRFVSAEFTAFWEGRDRPPAAPFARPIPLRGNNIYESGEVFSLAEATPRVRFRVQGSGGRHRVEGVVFHLGLRVDHGGTPEEVEVRGFAVSRIEPPAAGAAEDEASPADGAAKARRVVLCPEGMPPVAVMDAWRKRGLRERPGLAPADGETVAGVWCPTLALSEGEAARVADFARDGAALWLGIGPGGLRGEPPAPLRPWLPANLWSFRDGLDRKRTEAIPYPAGTGEDALPPLPLSHRYDLHVPGSPIESPMARFLPREWLREDRERYPLIAVRAVAATDATLPLWIEARIEASAVELFSFNPEDAAATSSPAYGDWAAAMASAPLDLREAAGPAPADARPAAEERWTIAAARRPFSIVLEEDETTLSELDPAQPPREGIDGISSRRYVYRTGTAPRLRVRIRNHLCNIAPLAAPADELWPENPSAPGLVDGALTTASVRGKLPIHALWTGRNGSAGQRLSLRWPGRVAVRGIRLWGFGEYRYWFRANPSAFTVAADDGLTVLSVDDAAFDRFPAAPERAVHETMAPAPFATASLRLDISGLDPKANIEPRRDWPSNCAIAEWEVLGWAGEQDAAPSRALSLRVVREDLLDGIAETNALSGATEIAFCDERSLDIELPARDAFGPVRWRFQAMEGDRVVAEEAFDALFVPPDAPAMAPRLASNAAHAGLLCSPGWHNVAPFGLGMNRWTQGWGGAHDQIWVWENDLLETGSGARDDPARLFGGALRASHYTNPWKRLPSGANAFRYSADVFLERLAAGDWHRQGKTFLYLGGSDRWNGIPTGVCFTWDHFVRFDRWLRDQGRPGLRGRSRAAISREIREELGDLWQTFLMRDYADLQLAVQRDFEERDLGYVFETHGSFPLAGGELGADLAKTHRGVGTDLFWELQRQDLWGTLGRRAAVVASNPDLQSGAYDEWGWVNTEQNQWWFGSNSDIPPARRQWYATYFLGRVDLSGAFLPYHYLGYSSQGNHGPRYDMRDHAARCRVHQLATHLRPEEAAGYGVVVSWRGQERRMWPRLGRSGFGLWPADGEDGVEEMCGAVFSALAKQGAPVAFVTSTHALREWRGTNPLILVDAPNWEDWEWDAARKAQKNGAPLFAVGAPHPRLANKRVIADLGKASAQGGAPLLWSRVRAAAFDAIDAADLAARIADALEDPISVPPGIAATPFVAQGRLFLAVCRQNDLSGPVSVTLRPGFLHAASANATRAVSLDDGCALPVESLPDGRLRFTLQLAADDGKVAMICP